MTISAIGGTPITILGRKYFMQPKMNGPGYSVFPQPTFVLPPVDAVLPWSNPAHDIRADFEAYR